MSGDLLLQIDQDGAPRIPPPAYHPDLVADAILGALTRPQRQITVGGVGLLQILGAAHAPRLADRISSLMPTLLKDPSRASDTEGNLFEPGRSGAVESARERGRRVSLYAMAQRAPVVAVGLGLAVVGAGVAHATRRATPRR